MQAQATTQKQFIDTITHGDCIQVMRQILANSVDFILSDPPYLVNYKDRIGRSIQNDVNSDWLRPAMKESEQKPHLFQRWATRPTRSSFSLSTRYRTS